MIEWLQVSGDAAADARYLASLRGMTNGVALRQRELRRLAELYGQGYRMNVERALQDGVSDVSPDSVPAIGREAAIGQMRNLLNGKG